jgi:hypothetical protein
MSQKCALAHEPKKILNNRGEISTPTNTHFHTRENLSKTAILVNRLRLQPTSSAF